MQYYFVAAALPPLSIGSKPEMSFQAFQELLNLNLTQADLKKVADLLRLIDLANMRALWMGLPLDERGNVSPKRLEEVILIRELPHYILDFLDRYETVEERLRYFSSLYASLFQEMAQKTDGFLRAYYTFEREVRLILTALRAKRMKRDVVREMQFEDPSDPLVMDILAQKDAAEYAPPQEYEDLKTLFLNHLSDPKALYRALLEYRFAKIEEMEENEPFSINHLLGYAARLLIVESWANLNQEQGIAIIEDLSKYG
ncbi:MAG: DUF2764 family protein [Verrucomicrobiota bacterium]|nr:DUF2764 family protein [Verrucomicrobiota bacterium]